MKNNEKIGDNETNHPNNGQLLPLHERFAQAIADGHRKYAAYMLAYPGVDRQTAGVNGVRLSQRPAIAARIAELQRMASARLLMGRDEALGILSNIARTKHYEPRDRVASIRQISAMCAGWLAPRADTVEHRHQHQHQVTHEFSARLQMAHQLRLGEAPARPGQVIDVEPEPDQDAQSATDRRRLQAPQSSRTGPPPANPFQKYLISSSDNNNPKTNTIDNQ